MKSRKWKLQRIYSSNIMEIDETFNAVELEKAGNTDKSIPLSKSN